MSGNYTVIKSHSTTHWNTTLNSLIIGGTTMWANSASVNATVNFQTSYRYIGVPKAIWYNICAQIQQLNLSLAVACFASNNVRPRGTGSCSQFKSDYNVTFQFNSTANITMPIKSL